MATDAVSWVICSLIGWLLYADLIPPTNGWDLHTEKSTHRIQVVDNDPEFLVGLKGVDKPFCFHLEAPHNDVIRMLQDPVTGIVVNARVFHDPDNHKSYLGTISIGADDLQVVASQEHVVVDKTQYQWLGMRALNERGHKVMVGANMVAITLRHRNVTVVVRRHFVFEDFGLHRNADSGTGHGKKNNEDEDDDDGSDNNDNSNNDDDDKDGNGGGDGGTGNAEGKDGIDKDNNLRRNQAGPSRRLDVSFRRRRKSRASKISDREHSGHPVAGEAGISSQASSPNGDGSEKWPKRFVVDGGVAPAAGGDGGGSGGGTNSFVRKRSVRGPFRKRRIRHLRRKKRSAVHRSLLRTAVSDSFVHRPTSSLTRRRQHGHVDTSYTPLDDKKRVVYLGFYISDSTDLSNTTHGLLGQFLFKHVTFHKMAYKKNRWKGHFRVVGKSRDIITHLSLRRNVGLNTTRACWRVRRQGRDLIDGALQDYVVPDLSYALMMRLPPHAPL